MKIKTTDLVFHLKTFTLFLTLLSLGSVFIIFYPRIYDLIFLVSVLLLSILTKAKILKKTFFITVGIIIVCLLHAWIVAAPLVNYIGIITKIILVILLIVAFRYDYKDMAKYLYRALYLLMILGIINFILIITVNQWFVEIQTSDGGYKTNTLGYLFNTLSVYNFQHFTIPRNQGAFWEPGIFQGIMNLLVYIILIGQRQKISKAIMPALMVISSFSTTGFILLTILLIIKIVRDYRISKTIIVGLLCLPLILIFANLMTNNIKDKFEGGAYRSSFDRTFDLLAGIEVVKKHPIAGIGYNADKYLYIVEDEEILLSKQTISQRRGNTNSIITIFFYFGIPLALFLLFRLFNQHIFFNKISFFTLICIFLLAEPILMSHFIILLILSSIKSPQRI